MHKDQKELLEEIKIDLETIPKVDTKVLDKESGIVFSMFRTFSDIKLSLALKEKQHSVGYKLVTIQEFDKNFTIVKNDIIDEFSKRLFDASKETRDFLLKIIEIDKYYITPENLDRTLCICHTIVPEKGAQSWRCPKHGRLFKL